MEHRGRSQQPSGVRWTESHLEVGEDAFFSCIFWTETNILDSCDVFTRYESVERIRKTFSVFVDLISKSKKKELSHRRLLSDIGKLGKTRRGMLT